MDRYHFVLAYEDEKMVFGEERPGYDPYQVQGWIEFMQVKGFRRVCYLLKDEQEALKMGNATEHRQMDFLTLVAVTG